MVLSEGYTAVQSKPAVRPAYPPIQAQRYNVMLPRLARLILAFSTFPLVGAYGLRWERRCKQPGRLYAPQNPAGRLGAVMMFRLVAGRFLALMRVRTPWKGSGRHLRVRKLQPLVRRLPRWSEACAA